MRRLPVYLLLDTSGSMYGEPIEAVKNGLNLFITSLRQNPYALETAYISVITFDSIAKQTVALTDLINFQVPSIEAQGATSMGAALNLLCDCIDKEVVKNTTEQKGDWKPICFLFTDGCPTDNIDKAVERVKKYKFAALVGCAAGSGADKGVLHKITDSVVVLDTLDKNGIEKFFQWISSSIASSSQKIDGGGEIDGLGELPLPPAEIKISLEKN